MLMAVRVILLRETSVANVQRSFNQRVFNAVDRGAAHVVVWRLEGGHVGIGILRAIRFTGPVAEAPPKVSRGPGPRRRPERTFASRRLVETPLTELADDTASGPTFDAAWRPYAWRHSCPDHGSMRPHEPGSSGTDAPGHSRARHRPRPLNTTSTFLDSVAGQGGGAVRAWNALRVSTIVEPAGLAFDDTEHRHASPLRLADNNTGAAEVIYKLANLPAVACVQSHPTPSATATSHSTFLRTYPPNRHTYSKISSRNRESMPGRQPIIEARTMTTLIILVSRTPE
ncbi:hypothetical protein J3458_022091 [Metarhizium acridum]|uniref:uncharacterized protein n=1 Tax=Metarhizium acridum TaxID=92637 RepID=UPI001C6BB955|nr:hypothetical protein J3458_022091 [Metarhizium acridum]